MSILEVELYPELEQRIRQEAEKRGVAPSVYVSVSLEDRLGLPGIQTEPLHDAMEFAGASREALQGIDVDKFIREQRDDWDDRP